MTDASSRSRGLTDGLDSRDRLGSLAIALQKQLRLLLKMSPAAIIVFDSAGKIHQWSAAATALFGWEEGETRQAVISRLFPQESFQYIQEALLDLKSQVEPRRHQAQTGSIELAGLKKNGETFPLTIQISAWYGMDDAVVFQAVAQDISDRKRAEELIQQNTALEERQRLARDLHDSVLQTLTGVFRQSEVGQIYLSSNDLVKAEATFSQIAGLCLQAIREVRLLVYQLRPPVLEEEGLANALLQRLASVEGRSNMDTRLVVEEEFARVALDASLQETLFFAAQEALNNTLKHARASTVTVHLRREGSRVMMEVVDNGCGFDPARIGQGGWGLVGLQERVQRVKGKVEISSRPGETRVSVIVPAEKSLESLT